MPFLKNRGGSPRRRGPSDRWLLENTFLFGAERVPTWLTEYDMLISGGKGSGKTTALIALMISRIMGLVVSGKPFNVHAYTPKPDDFLPLLKAVFEPLGISVRSTNPFMRDAWAWDGSLDLWHPPAIDELVAVSIKESGSEQNPFFKKAAQLVLRGLVLSLATTHRGVWTMRHVAGCLRSMGNVRRVLARCPLTSHLVSLVSKGQGVTSQNLYATLLAELKGLELIAALTDGVPDERRFSVADAANQPGVIWVWGSDPRYNATIEPWNAVQFELVGHELLIRGNIGVETLLFFDEFPQFNGGVRSAIMKKILEFGRSSLVRSVLAVQTPAQVMAIYGPEEGETILGQMHLSLVFKHSDMKGKTYWSERFGRMTGFEEKPNYSRQRGGGQSYGASPGSSTNWSVTEGFNVERFDLERVTPSDIGGLPLGNWKRGIYGYATVPTSLETDPRTGMPETVRWRFFMSPEWISRHVPTVEGFTPYGESLHPESSYFMKPLEDWEYEFLGLEKPSGPKPRPRIPRKFPKRSSEFPKRSPEFSKRSPK